MFQYAAVGWDTKAALTMCYPVQIKVKVLQDLEGRVYQRGGLRFVETRWVYHEIHKVRFPAPALFGQKGTMWKMEFFHFAKGAPGKFAPGEE